MKITRDKLLESDFDTLFTRDPGTFFEAILINILWDKTPADLDQELIARQQYVFEKWHEYFSVNLRQDIEKELAIAFEPIAGQAYRNGLLAGRIKALEELPFKRSGLGKTVDITEVTKILNKLKAVEPEGVSNENQGNTN